MKVYDTIVIGGGASGLVACGNLKGSTLLIEAQDRVGKKILATGNGRCNLSNENLSGEFYSSPRFFDEIFGANRTIVADYFSRLGLLVKPDKSGRLYPYTMQASTVLDILRYAVKCEVLLSTRVLDIVKKADVYNVITDKGEYYSTNVIVSTGGGKVATKLLTTTAFSPSLCPVKTDTSRIKGLDGIRVQCGLNLIKDGASVYSEFGEVLFRTYGVSGVAVFNASSYIARSVVKGQNPKWQISLDLVSDNDIDTVKTIITNRLAGNVEKDKLLLGIVPNKVAQCLLKDIVKLSVDNVMSVLLDYRLDVKSLYNDNYQVTSGGVSLDSIDAEFQSKIHKGMFVTGEALDMDGLCGGYNLHWAFMSGLIASGAINSKL